MDDDWLLPRNKVCGSGNHHWRTSQDAARCCNGWLPIPVPFEFWQNLPLWAGTPPLTTFSGDVPWVTVLIPATEREFYSRLAALCDPAFLRRLRVQPEVLLTH